MPKVRWSTFDHFALIFPFFGISIFAIVTFFNVLSWFSSPYLLLCNIIAIMFLVNGVAFLYYTWGGEVTRFELGDEIENVYQLIGYLQEVLDISRVKNPPDFLFTSGCPVFKFGDTSRKRIVFMPHQFSITILLSRYALEHKDDVTLALEEIIKES